MDERIKAAIFWLEIVIENLKKVENVEKARAETQFIGVKIKNILNGREDND